MEYRSIGGRSEKGLCAREKVTREEGVVWSVECCGGARGEIRHGDRYPISGFGTIRTAIEILSDIGGGHVTAAVSYL